MSEKLFANRPLSFYEGKSDAEIRAVEGVGPKTLEKIRDAQKAVEAEAQPAEAEPAAEKKCADCDGSFVPKDPRHKRCPDCHAKWLAERKSGKGRRRQGGGQRQGGERRGGWVPTQEDLKDALESAAAELANIKTRSSYPDGNPRYDFAEADELFAKVTDLFVAGEFGSMEFGGRVYKHLGLFLYQGALGKAYEIVAKGKIGDARRIATEEGWDLTIVDDAEVEVVYLIDGGKAEQAAAEAHGLLRSALRKRSEARKAEEAAREAANAEKRAAFVANLEEVSRPQSQGGGRRGRGRKGSQRREEGGAGHRSKPYERKGRRGGTTIADYVAGD